MDQAYYYQAQAFYDLWQGDYAQAEDDEFQATEYWALASDYWLSTKVDGWANNNVLLTSESHFDLHTASVWNNIAPPCGLH